MCAAEEERRSSEALLKRTGRNPVVISNLCNKAPSSYKTARQERELSLLNLGRSFHKEIGMPNITRIDTGPRMSRIVKHNGVAYFAGFVGVVGESVEDQTADILGQIEEALAKCGSSKENILRIEIWLSDMADFAAMNSVYDTWVAKGHQPGRACGESKLADAGYKVEFIVTAAYA